MAYLKQYEITDLVIKQTELGDLKWSSTPSGSYETRLAKFIVRIAADADFKGETYYTITILDSDASIIDSFSDVDLDTDREQHNRNNVSYYSKLKETYESLDRIISGTDDKLSKLLLALKNNEEIPF